LFTLDQGKTFYITGGHVMKIAVSAKGKSLNSEVDPRFGRTIGFVLFDTETGSSTYLDNSAHQDLSQGAGIQTAQMIRRGGD
jgi:predicted Fe-Mo cluster-binding NifX family protein